MIASIIGLMNSGKTLFMTYKLYEYYRKGYTIISNYDLNFPHSKINRDYLMLMGQKQITLNKVAIGLDEIWIWLDARKVHENTVATYFFNQSSKDDTPIFLTAQYNTQNDKRLRQNIHKIYQCDRVIYWNNKFIPIDNEFRFLPKKFQEVLYIKIDEFKRINIGGITNFILQKTFYLKASKLFPLYDTRQKIYRSKKNE